MLIWIFNNIVCNFAAIWLFLETENRKRFSLQGTELSLPSNKKTLCHLLFLENDVLTTQARILNFWRGSQHQQFVSSSTEPGHQIMMATQKHTQQNVPAFDGKKRTSSEILFFRYVVAFTIERWIVVLFPFKRGDMCTVKRANIVVISLAIFGFIAYNFGIWIPTAIYIEGPNGKRISSCFIKEKYSHLNNIINNIDTVVTLILPSCMIIVLNVQIIRAVTKINSDHRQVLYSQGQIGRQGSNSSGKGSGRISNNENNLVTTLLERNPPAKASNSIKNDSSKGPASKRTNLSSRNLAQHSTVGQNKVTKMLLVVSTFFLILNFPSHTMRLYFFIVGLVNPNYRPHMIMISLQKLFTYIYYVNFAINFFLYSLCGNNFRKALWQLLKGPFESIKSKFCKTPKRGRNSSMHSCQGQRLCLTEKKHFRKTDSVTSHNNGRTSVSVV